MGILIAPETPYGKELWRWENYQGHTHPTDKSVRGMRPNGYQPFPARLYKVTQRNPLEYEAETANDEAEQRNLLSRGFVSGGLADAVLQFEHDQDELAKIAAARNYEDRNMSAKALAESEAAQEASSRHLGEIPRTPVKRRGRPPKVVID